MPALITVGCILLFFAFILSLKAKITVEYNDEVTLYIRVLFVKIKILPKKRRKNGPHSMSERKAAAIKKRLIKKAEKKRLKKLRKAERKKERQQLSAGKSSRRRTLAEILDMISSVTDIVKAATKTFFSHLKIDLARLHITVASDDAANTAIYYGVICDALTHLLPLLEAADGFTTPKAKDISVNVDYLAEHITADVKISMSLRVWHVLHVALTVLKKLVSRSVKKRAAEEQSK